MVEYTLVNMAHIDKKHVVGLRQILKEGKKGNLSSIMVARDADSHYREQLVAFAEQQGIELTIHGTRKSIAMRFGIEVDSAAVGLLKQQQ